MKTEGAAFQFGQLFVLILTLAVLMAGCGGATNPTPTAVLSTPETGGGTTGSQAVGTPGTPVSGPGAASTAIAEATTVVGAGGAAGPDETTAPGATATTGETAAATTTGTPVPTPNPEALAAMEPGELVQAFYGWYTGYMDPDAGGEMRNPLVDQAYQNSPFLTNEYVATIDDIIAGFGEGRGFDPFLCAQDVPQEFTVEEAGMAGEEPAGTTEVVVRTDLQPDHAFTVELSQEDGQWKINNVRCDGEAAGAGGS